MPRAPNKRLLRGSAGPRPHVSKTKLKAGKLPKKRGRPKGARNILTRDILEAIRVAMEIVGEDGRGKDQLQGYMVRLAKMKNPVIFGGFVRATLPMQINVNRQTIISYETAEDIDKDLAAQGLPKMREIFQIDYQGDKVEEAELVPASELEK